MELVCSVPDFPNYGEWSKPFVGELLRRSSHLDVLSYEFP